MTLCVWLGMAVGCRGATAADSVVYASKHYEVRAHGQPVKYVWNEDFRIARVTGSISDRQRVQRLRLRRGWNLVGLGVNATNVMAQLEASGPVGAGNKVRAYRYDHDTEGWLPLVAGESVDAGAVMWMHADKARVVPVNGNYVAPGEREIHGPEFLPGGGIETVPLDHIAPDVMAMVFDAARQEWSIQNGNLALADSRLPTVLGSGEALFLRPLGEEPTLWKMVGETRRVCYYHPDHLGSTTVTTDVAGRRIDELAYYPFGSLRQSHRFGEEDAAEPYDFVQKERDRESGFHDFGERSYHPVLGRWLTTDPREELGGDLNPYTYGMQNPLKYQDPDGREITIAKTVSGKGSHARTHYEIHVRAAVINLSPMLEQRGFDRAKTETFAADLKKVVEASFSGSEGKVSWKMTADIRVIDKLDQLSTGEHVFRLVDQTYTRGRGASELGGLWMEISASAILAARPSNPKAVKDYLSPESTGAHELGHTGRLEHWDGKTPNLMQRGSDREYDNTSVTGGQIRQMYDAFHAKTLNQGSNRIGSQEAARRQ